VAPGDTLHRDIAPGRYAWVHVARGSMLMNGHKLGAGDGAAISDETELLFTGEGSGPAEFLFFDLA
jgi:quercetin 2,3-dioxygenase